MASRSYDSPGRRAKAQQTEQEILTAARDLLLADGWVGMTMARIAARAGVSAQLLYKTYGTKAALAKRLYDVTLAGDEEPTPLNDRPEIAAITAEPDPRRKIAAYVHLARTINERLGPLNVRLRAGAAAGDADLTKLVATTDRERLAGNGGIVRHLAASGALRAGLTVERATHMVWILLSPETLLRLTGDCGWTFSEVEVWLTDQVATALLDNGRQRGCTAESAPPAR